MVLPSGMTLLIPGGAAVSTYKVCPSDFRQLQGFNESV